MSPQILLLGVGIFLTRILDVSIGTLRTLVTVQGRWKLAFVLGFFEVTIWVGVVSTVVQRIHTLPILVIFYGLGFAAGNVVGIRVEQRIGLGHVVLRVFTREAGQRLAERIRRTGQPVTSFQGEGSLGPVTELCIVTRRKNLKRILLEVDAEDPNAFYIAEQAREVRLATLPARQVPTGWRAVQKRK